MIRLLLFVPVVVGLVDVLAAPASAAPVGLATLASLLYFLVATALPYTRQESAAGYTFTFQAPPWATWARTLAFLATSFAWGLSASWALR